MQGRQGQRQGELQKRLEAPADGVQKQEEVVCERGCQSGRWPGAPSCCVKSTLTCCWQMQPQPNEGLASTVWPGLQTPLPPRAESPVGGTTTQRCQRPWPWPWRQAGRTLQGLVDVGEEFCSYSESNEKQENGGVASYLP